VAHIYNPSYLGGRDQEDSTLKPAWANSSQDPILKIPKTKKGLVEWFKVYGLEFQPQFLTKNKQKQQEQQQQKNLHYKSLV
jgi:hypothetical protein